MKREYTWQQERTGTRNVVCFTSHQVMIRHDHSRAEGSAVTANRNASSHAPTVGSHDNQTNATEDGIQTPLSSTREQQLDSEEGVVGPSGRACMVSEKNHHGLGDSPITFRIDSATKGPKTQPKRELTPLQYLYMYIFIYYFSVGNKLFAFKFCLPDWSEPSEIENLWLFGVSSIFFRVWAPLL